ncbi:hypothetical protein MBLNU459_g0535t1 [Dothideomycetes sp. NU459]
MTIMRGTDSGLVLESEKIVSVAIQSGLLTVCPRTDLLAVVTVDETVNVYRYGGQRAFSVKRIGATAVVSLRWIRDGRCLAIALDDGTVATVSGETGRIVRLGRDEPFGVAPSRSNPQQTDTTITCLGWGTKSTERSRVQHPFSKSTTKTVEDWFDGLESTRSDDVFGFDATTDELRGQTDPLKDLPGQLASINVESVLPRLGPIAARTAGAKQDDLFTTQAAVDDYFQSMQRKDKLAADILVVGQSNGRTRIIIDDILETGYQAQGFPGSDDQPRVPLVYASHPLSAHHALLCGLPMDLDNLTNDPKGSALSTSYKTLSLTMFDIPLLDSGGSHLHFIVSGTAQVKDLCTYITSAILFAKSEWTLHTTLPGRFMANINETLEEKGEGVIDWNLYRSVTTGHYSPTILEWLRDELAERGHKRWDVAMTSFYVELSKIMQTNLLPALERCSVVVTKLRGLARFYESTDKFDVSPSFFTDILEAIGCLQLLVHETIRVLGEEKRQFRAFSKWLRYSVDIAAADPESVSAKELAEREAPNLDYDKILLYIEGAMTKTRLNDMVFVQVDGAENQHITPDDVDQAIQAARNYIREKSELLSLHVLSANMSKVCKAAHDQILRWQLSAGPTTQNFELEPGPMTNIFDMRTICLAPTIFKTIALIVPLHERNRISVHCITTDASTASPHKEWRIIDLPHGTHVKSVKFLDDGTFLALVGPGLIEQASDPIRLLRIPFTASKLDGTIDVVVDCRDPEIIDELSIHLFDAGDKFVPAEMVISNRKGKENVCLVAKNRYHWKIYSLKGEGAVDYDNPNDTAEARANYAKAYVEDCETNTQDGMVFD